MQFKSEPCHFENLVGWSLRRVGKRSDKFELCSAANDTAYKFCLAPDYERPSSSSSGAASSSADGDALQHWLDALRAL